MHSAQTNRLHSGRLQAGSPIVKLENGIATFSIGAAGTMIAGSGTVAKAVIIAQKP